MESISLVYLFINRVARGLLRFQLGRCIRSNYKRLISW